MTKNKVVKILFILPHLPFLILKNKNPPKIKGGLYLLSKMGTTTATLCISTAN